MAANENTVLQVNFKTPAGSLINVYASSIEQFDVLVSELAERASILKAVEDSLTSGSVSHPAAIGNVLAAFPNATVQPTVTVPSLPVPSAPAPVAPVQAQATPNCDHGVPAKYIKGGISKASGKPYPAFFACGMPRESQCQFKQSAA